MSSRSTPNTPAGVQNRGDIESAVTSIEEVSFDSEPETIHEKAYHLLVANLPFVSANKRTVLNVTVVFYFPNEYRFEYDNEERTMLKGFGTDEAAIDEKDTTEYLRSHTEKLDLARKIEE
ncbi:hypothetical protein [Halorubrum trueperi]|uniref:Fido domain-containing protein n=1 Tax=Halorubrum trueperi TaxID=2004704 RepID=A0ABD5UNN8_9EURY